MEELLKGMLDAAKKDKKQFIALKNLAVKCQQFELACKIRELEKELFPETEEERKAKDLSKEINNLFSMVGLNVTPDVCWLVYETIKMHSKKKGKFSLKDAVELVSMKEKLFTITD